MAIISWSEAMSVGVPRLDRDHRVLIGLINRLEGDRSRRPDDKVIGEVLETMMPGGGYVAGASHDTILEETPVENVLAMFEAVREYGVYG